MKRSIACSIVTILVLGTIIGAVADETIDITLTGTTTTLQHQGQTLTLSHPANGTAQSQFTVPVSDFNLSEVIDYQLIENVCKSVNTSEMTRIVSEEVDQGLAAQQDYIRQTFLPEVSEKEQLTADLNACQNSLEFAEQQGDRYDLIFSLYNQSETARAVTCEKEQNWLLITMFLVVMIVIAVITFLFYSKGRNWSKNLT